MTANILLRSACIGFIAGLGVFAHLTGAHPLAPSLAFGVAVMMTMAELITTRK